MVVATRRARVSAWVVSTASTMTRMMGSVPLGRTRMRPEEPSSARAASTALATSVEAARALSPGTLMSTWGYRVITLAASASVTPRRASTASRCRAVRIPSPVVACSARMMWPDCSPPRT